MKNVLIIGATGSLGRTLTNQLLNHDDYQLTLFARHASQLDVQGSNVKVIDGDVLNQADLVPALAGQDFVFAALSGALPQMATAIVQGMDATHVQRLAFIASMGIYDEIPAAVGAEGNLSVKPMMQKYRDAADIVTASDVNGTVIRPGWFDNGSDDYEITGRNEPFGGHDVARAAIGHFVTRLIDDPKLYSNTSVGINRP
ncbi:NAD(P)H-binding protein (plasmid) [Nicoliella spurrieriana]|uniref:NAD(P)H-binding protein n=1 Tax=Nicoliella spurrieriana TaxID=2925830 RepID=A0A976X4L2_9LACO|nr:NAD(P)H-binding protein [Nicoliella spurrieriana]UQS85935.1 NAD(P)H-binding protein [Nicoliella spurrieriana]